eukprot:CAMPEP_0183472040 /NCGR_PEP_ID=MMETSP0370-20130417/158839_1 /TAXON_ID=268820 /ORGANISM="Peridinium aciculiferum, Strain PAER-2" /LENGTH=34 /DNA_ID= /DNA_START= /DNA_END= /DNA_ORIENTATION=
MEIKNKFAHCKWMAKRWSTNVTNTDNEERNLNLA